MPDSTRKKSIYIFELAVRELARTGGGTNYLRFCTLTFAENVAEKKEAMRRWHCLRDRLRRFYAKKAAKRKGTEGALEAEDFQAAGVWQRQKRGAWHLHLFVNIFIPVAWLRAAAVECGFGQQMRIDMIGDEGCGVPGHVGDVRRAVRYATRYAVRDVETGEYAGEALFTYCGGVRRGSTVNFHWASGLRSLWRRGCSWWSENVRDGETTKQPFWLLVAIGFDNLSDEERAYYMKTYDSVYRWWFGPVGPGNPLEPF